MLENLLVVWKPPAPPPHIEICSRTFGNFKIYKGQLAKKQKQKQTPQKKIGAPVMAQQK